MEKAIIIQFPGDFPHIAIAMANFPLSRSQRQRFIRVLVRDKERTLLSGKFPSDKDRLLKICGDLFVTCF